MVAIPLIALGVAVFAAVVLVAGKLFEAIREIAAPRAGSWPDKTP